ncbi:hypothetical protein BB934_35705 (plasmid) [Microvirga ossetica]|uniref:Uncharacterized protein n=1 Tax=Microvirga ossetica TaxID=1882682 RepID=A0A1B2EUF9_9HYPH|nr:hypothetical protein [Microvirga ossetica]ANY83604.1 hypothetical protein BB934_35705 [Microvirga ossetica]
MMAWKSKVALRYLSIAAFILVAIDPKGNSAFAANTIHGYDIGTWRLGDIGQVIDRYIERTILHLDTGVRAHSFAPKRKCNDQTYQLFKEALQANLQKAESDDRHLVWIDELKTQSCDLILGHKWSRGPLTVEYKIDFYSPISCSRIGEFINSEAFSRSYDRPILVSGTMSGEAKLESDTEVLRHIHRNYVACEDMSPNKLRITARFARR